MGEFRGRVTKKMIFPPMSEKFFLFSSPELRHGFCRIKESDIGNLAVSCLFHGNPFFQVILSTPLKFQICLKMGRLFG